MVVYNLSHLTQPSNQDVSGPIQDDEALLLFALIRVMLIRRVLEIGGLGGYSAKNFCEAVGGDGVVYTVDLNQVPTVAANHVVIQKDARHLTGLDLGGEPLGLVFFDCHKYDAQIELFKILKRDGIIKDETVLAFHDTNTHPRQVAHWAYPVEEGWVHQNVERRMVNEFKGLGYDAFVLGTNSNAHDSRLPFRHGLTIMKKWKPFSI